MPVKTNTDRPPLGLEIIEHRGDVEGLQSDRLTGNPCDSADFLIELEAPPSLGGGFSLRLCGTSRDKLGQAARSVEGNASLKMALET